MTEWGGLFWLYQGDLPRPKPLCCLDVVKKFVMFGGGGGGGWVCKHILELRLCFDQAEPKIKCLSPVAFRNINLTESFVLSVQVMSILG
jgi:hypothetical protein